MKLNYETCLLSEDVILVPYRPEHVPNYHEWMKDPDLLEATGSEPLSYEEEVDMQKEWKDDEKKCTFIVHARVGCDYQKSTEIETNGTAAFCVVDNLDAMIGDVNLFLSEIEDDDNDNDFKSNDVISGTSSDCCKRESSEPLMQAEIDIMIAKSEYQGKGLGRAATCAMLLYGTRKLGIHRFFCKINEDNIKSIRLFKSIGFEQCDYAACFKQVELELRRPLLLMEKIFERNGGSYIEIACERSSKE